MAVDVSRNFSQFLKNISLGDPQVPRMNSAANAVTGFLRQSYNLPEDAVFMQGSYANHTAIEPVDGGEYDVDIVAICASDDQSPETALGDLEKRLNEDGRYAGKVKLKTPCVRIEYASDDVGDFHVDVVPARLNTAGSAPIEVPRRKDGWHESAPAEYTEWCRSQGELYVRTVKMLKRWRSEHQSVRTAIKSILLQVLIAECMPHEENDATRIATTISNLEARLRDLTDPPVVTNPVLSSENLASRWTKESFKEFKTQLAEAKEIVDRASTSNDEVEVAEAWVELFGEDFPTKSPSAFGIELSDYSHAQEPADKGWTEVRDSNFSATVSATLQRGRNSSKRYPYPSGGKLIFQGGKLHFTAKVVAPIHVEVWWQVANTGNHARISGGLRGEIFKGKGLNKKLLDRQNENWESTSYTGSHLIRALLVRDNNVVATSDWFTVNAWGRNRPFRR